MISSFFNYLSLLFIASSDKSIKESKITFKKKIKQNEENILFNILIFYILFI